MLFVPKVLAFAGSLRKDSFNKKLVKLAAEGARSAGAEVTYLDLKELPMPIYDGDIEASEGLPPNAKRFKTLMIEHDGFLIATPEYNSSITGALKNAIDWASRPESNEQPLIAFRGKIVSLICGSPGAFGGMRSLAAVRSIFSELGTLVLPGVVAIPRVHEAFGTDGILKDPGQKQKIESRGRELAETIRKLKG